MNRKQIILVLATVALLTVLAFGASAALADEPNIANAYHEGNATQVISPLAPSGRLPVINPACNKPSCRRT
jgi:hypothetical protein